MKRVERWRSCENYYHIMSIMRVSYVCVHGSYRGIFPTANTGGIMSEEDRGETSIGWRTVGSPMSLAFSHKTKRRWVVGGLWEPIQRILPPVINLRKTLGVHLNIWEERTLQVTMPCVKQRITDRYTCRLATRNYQSYHSPLNRYLTYTIPHIGLPLVRSTGEEKGWRRGKQSHS